MDLEQFKTTLKSKTANLNEQTLIDSFEQFTQQAGDSNVNDFAIYLHKQQIIDTQILSSVLSETPIEITSFDHLKAQAQQRQNQNFRALNNKNNSSISEITHSPGDEQTLVNPELADKTLIESIDVHDADEHTLVHAEMADMTLVDPTMTERVEPTQTINQNQTLSDDTLVMETPQETRTQEEGEPESESYESPTYDLLGTVGQGGMGEILLAKDRNLLRTVAYKKLHPQFAAKKHILEQFLNEVQITSQLEHPNVVPIYNLEVTPDGNIAYSMKLVQGVTLKDLIHEAQAFFKKGQILPDSHSLPRFLEHFLKVCSALEFAHNKAVLHRDLKPANLMIGAYGEVNVMDWGIACLMGRTPNSKQAVGTPRYMSPEQAAALNDKLDARSDLFSLGLILYELVTLKQATVRGKNVMETLRNTIQGKRHPVEHYQPEIKIPKELVAIIDKATQRKRANRYQSVKELADDVRRYLRGDAVLAQPDSFVQSIQRWISQNREKTLTAILGILFISALMFTGSMYYRHISLIAAQRHDDLVHDATTLVAVRGNEIDQQFFYLEGLLRSYGTAIQQRLKYGAAFPGKYFTLQDYQNPATRPPNTEFLKVYKTDVNVDWGMILHAPGSDPTLMKMLSAKMHPLQHVMKNLVIDSYVQDRNLNLSPQALDQLIKERKMPILWIFMALENGYYMIYPSTYNYKDGYDPRQRPWYKMAKSTGRFAWQEPYRTTGGEVDLPCLLPLYDENKKYIGTAVIEMTFDFVQENFLDIEQQGVLESALVNSRGEIIVSTVDHYAAGRDASKKQTKTKLVHVDNDVVKGAMQGKRSGFHIAQKPEGNVIYVYYYISSLGWFYVVKADEERFLNHLETMKSDSPKAVETPVS